MAVLQLATEEDLPRVLPLVAAYHAFEGIASSAAQREAAVLPLLRGTPLGALWLIGPRRAPVGYIAAGLGWSIEFGGPDAFVDEFFIREGVRGRGMGGQALEEMAAQLAGMGVVALHLEVAGANERARTFYQRKGFEDRAQFGMMSRVL